MTSPCAERVIRPGRAWFRLDAARLLHYRDLLFILVRRDFVARYQQTILGPLWFIIQPLAMTLVFTVVFARGLGTSTDGVPPFLFYLCGMLGWNYFAGVLQGSGNTFQSNAAIFTKVYFPRLVMPLSVGLSNLIAFSVQGLSFLALYAVYWLGADPAARAAEPQWLTLLTLPLVLVQTALLALGCGMLISALSAKYRDLQHVVPFLVQLWMFVTPVIYPLSQLSPRLQAVASLNPMTAPVESFRLAFLGVGTVTPGQWALSIGVTLVLLVAGFAGFQRVERGFADNV